MTCLAPIGGDPDVFKPERIDLVSEENDLARLIAQRDRFAGIVRSLNVEIHTMARRIAIARGEIT